VFYIYDSKQKCSQQQNPHDGLERSWSEGKKELIGLYSATSKRGSRKSLHIKCSTLAVLHTFYMS